MGALKQNQRRRFLKENLLFGLAGAMGLANVKVFAGDDVMAAEPSRQEKPGQTEDLQDYKPFGVRSPYETAGRKHDGARIFPPHRTAPIDQLVGAITPSGLHFVASHSVAPNTDPKDYRLLIHGMVDS